MPVRDYRDLKYASAAPGSYGSAFQAVETLEPYVAYVQDGRASGAPNLVAGTLWVSNQVSTNTGEAYYLPSSIANQALQPFHYGILQGQGTLPQNLSLAGQVSGGLGLRIVQNGVCSALCTTGATAIAAGTPLVADGNGNLTALNAPSAAPTPTAAPTGTAGAVTMSYKLAAVSYDGVATALGTAGTTTTANAAVTGTNGVAISWTPNADAAYYIVVRTTANGGTTAGVIGVTQGSSFLDAGQPPMVGTTATVYFPTLAAPNAPTVAQVAGAVAGTTTYTYKVTAINPQGVFSAESTGTNLTTGAATLTNANANKITWTAVTGAQWYAIDRTAGGATQGFIGYSNNPTGGFIDYGLVATTFTAQTIPNPTPRPGSVLAVALGSLAASTATATAVTVMVGGY